MPFLPHSRASVVGITSVLMLVLLACATPAPPAPGGAPSQTWRLLDTSIEDGGLQFNIEEFLASDHGLYVSYSIIADKEHRGMELRPRNMQVADDGGRKFRAAGVTDLGSVSGVSIGAISLGAYEPGSRRLTISVPSLESPFDGDWSIIVDGDWTLQYSSRNAWNQKADSTAPTFSVLSRIMSAPEL